MNVKNCRRCRKLFNYVAGQQLCPSCRQELEDIFSKVKDFVRDNRDVGIKDVAREFKISDEQVRQWVREERLIFSDPSVSGIVCESCGLPIATGRFCEKCKAETINTLNSLLPEDKPAAPVKNERDKAKMRFIRV